MPMYEYECVSHGVFEGMRALCDAALPERCPSCGLNAARILSAPCLAQVAGSERIARDRNERSRHEPRLVRGPDPYPNAKANRASQAKQREEGTRPALRASHGSRPWALEHH
jgi:putative FmdB family regulatory protein